MNEKNGGSAVTFNVLTEYITLWMIGVSFKCISLQISNWTFELRLFCHCNHQSPGELMVSANTLLHQLQHDQTVSICQDANV